MPRVPIVTFTFDDGTLDHYTHAAPILEKYGYRGIFCITTGYMDGTSAWDYPCMSRKMIKELSDRGHEVASHTVTHANMRMLWFQKGKAAVREELKQSYDTLSDVLDAPPKWFCYPYNRGCPMVSQVAREIGMSPFNPISRPNLGGYKWPTDAKEQMTELKKVVFRHGPPSVDLMFHGIVPNGGWNSFDNNHDFEKIVYHINEL